MLKITKPGVGAHYSAAPSTLKKHRHCADMQDIPSLSGAPGPGFTFLHD
ncbi:hypothetical protein [Rhodoferax saidenbachensis]|uniref:Uncharacterized protein n=1 Tax=Rhodoferax saidenbachensis TaxID=1484693 RepID=A0ABU1ZRF7_9BURK|nr:hypothetical protein [Rhodoferax saidenbachensis]MDR7308134.1 hypothetical protein [Rhodoferax saidenbachensis]